MTKLDIRRDLVTTIREGLDWYAFTVLPTDEYTCAALLRQRGIDTYVPTETRWRASNRWTKTRRNRHEIYVPALPGYVFAGFEGEPPWYGLSFNRMITGVVGKKHKPHPLVAQDLADFFATCSNGSLRAPEAERHMQTAEEFKAGDTVTVIYGALREHSVKVVELRGRMAKVLAPLFGTERELHVPIETMSKSA